MAKKYSLAAFAAIILLSFISCSKDWEAQKPVYLSIPEIRLNTDYVSEGTSNSRITTVWIYANGDAVGVFELPCTVPAILNEGNNEITMYAGINLNGTSSSRAIYEGFEPLQFDLNYTPSGRAVADTIEIDSANRVTGYLSRITVNIIEDFDGAGLNFEKTGGSDTNLRKTGINDPNNFLNLQNPAEDNGRAGILYTTTNNDLAEVASVKSLQLPVGGENVYLEMNYKCNIPFIVGVISDVPGATIQQATAVVTPKSDWNKIYINLVTEVSSQPTALGYKIYFRADHQDGLDTGRVFLDNLKLVYQRL